MYFNRIKLGMWQRRNCLFTTCSSSPKVLIVPVQSPQMLIISSCRKELPKCSLCILFWLSVLFLPCTCKMFASPLNLCLLLPTQSSFFTRSNFSCLKCVRVCVRVCRRALKASLNLITCSQVAISSRRRYYRFAELLAAWHASTISPAARRSLTRHLSSQSGIYVMQIPSWVVSLVFKLVTHSYYFYWKLTASLFAFVCIKNFVCNHSS